MYILREGQAAYLVGDIVRNTRRLETVLTYTSHGIVNN
jgi:hypothetical protein